MTGLAGQFSQKELLSRINVVYHGGKACKTHATTSLIWISRKPNGIGLINAFFPDILKEKKRQKKSLFLRNYPLINFLDFLETAGMHRETET